MRASAAHASVRSSTPRTLRLPLKVRAARAGGRSRWLAPLGALVALLGALALRAPAWVDALAAVAVGAGVVAPAIARRRREERRIRGFVVVDDLGVHRPPLATAALAGGVVHVGAGAGGHAGPTATGLEARAVAPSVPVARWNEPFGVTTFVNRAGTRALVAFTSPHATRVVRVRTGGAEDVAAARELFAHAATIAEDDVRARSADVADDADAALSATDALRLVRAVEAHAAGALDRAYLSDARGTPIELVGATLRIGDRAVDLGAPVEWRSIVFHETVREVTTVYQGTWIRQAATEAVLIAPIPPEPWSGKSPPRPEPPPPRELRVAIDRIFVAPIRRALEGAPRAPRTSRSIRAGAEGRTRA